MLTPVQLKSHIFQQSGRNAYKAEDVDGFFEEVTASYEQMFRENGELIKRIGLLADKLEEYKNDEDVIKSAVLSAQRAADLIVKEAKQSVEGITDTIDERLAVANEEAEKIVSEAKEKAEKYETEVMGGVDARYNDIIAEAQHKADDILSQAEAAAKDKVGAATRNITHESLVYDMLKKEVSEFRAELLAKYKAHIELISGLPETAAERLKTLEEIETREKEANFVRTLGEMPEDTSDTDENEQQIKQLEAVAEVQDEDTNDIFSGASPEIPEAAQVEAEAEEIEEIEDEPQIEFISEPEPEEITSSDEAAGSGFVFEYNAEDEADESDEFVVKTRLPDELFDENAPGLEFVNEDDSAETDNSRFEMSGFSFNDEPEDESEPEADAEELVEKFEEPSDDEPVEAVPLDKAKNKKGFKLNLSALNFDDEEDAPEEHDKPFRYEVIRDTTQEQSEGKSDWLTPDDEPVHKKGFFKKKK
ncbi:MAG: hypothetical protein GX051_08755 [Clostridiales bacterium]|nr:hypothetical protein [Clostridiales bacterium]